MLDIESGNFWKYVGVRGPSDCWMWSGKVDRYGYGLHRWNANGRRVATGAHRAMFRIATADAAIPAGYAIDHICAVPLCVNPAHLQCITVADNARLATSRNKKHSDQCRNGHSLSQEGREGDGSCSGCRRLRIARYKSRLRPQ